MKRTLPLGCILCLSILQPWGLSPLYGDTLHFKESYQKAGGPAHLQGKLKGVLKDVLIWEHPDIRGALKIDLDTIQTIEMDRMRENNTFSKPVGEESALLSFKNGDTLLGKVLGFQQQGILWEGKPFPHEVTIEPKNLKKIQFNRQPEVMERSSLSLRLTNGDLLLGEIKKLGEEFLVLSTTYGSELKIKRAMVENISLMGEGDSWVIYDASKANIKLGPSKEWSYEEGTFVSHRPSKTWIRLAAETHQKAAIEFLLHGGRGIRERELKISLFAMRNRHRASTYYDLYLGGGLARLTRCDFPSPHHHVPRTVSVGSKRITIPEILEDSENSRTKIGIYIDKKQREITLVANNRVVHTWRDPQKKEHWGTLFGLHSLAASTNILFISPKPIDQHAKIKISDFKILHWDGTLPNGRSQSERPKQDHVFLENDDKVEGHLLKIEKEHIFMAVEGLTDPLKIARDKIVKLALRKRARTRAKRNKEDVHIRFWDGSSITMQLKDFHAEKVKGTSENFGGENLFDWKAIQEIQFGIYDS